MLTGKQFFRVLICLVLLGNRLDSRGIKWVSQAGRYRFIVPLGWRVVTGSLEPVSLCSQPRGNCLMPVGGMPLEESATMTISNADGTPGRGRNLSEEVRAMAKDRGGKIAGKGVFAAGKGEYYTIESEFTIGYQGEKPTVQVRYVVAIGGRLFIVDLAFHASNPKANKYRSDCRLIVESIEVW